ncbi:Tryptophan synthase beta subunit-like PLP-dependent enzyme [Acididesulfobacillus acetoxydans]|uniref:Threonine synthase n=1 Tax=Acididesulfobacillus acetoxydans TaxID=1561005 RepID=A0A8S0WN63_9FIRM|nr:threonine synthase [Acididesulfobacillus acetoxydans]CAA7601074.1 Tryptophan synthase beta subunit-like PLP-dependent enzyme [Acididesulfobacillus acetoxydans]CEJ06948.1 Threonine synthase-like 1 [Acididesulfobacillus acetoxydans]
MYESTRGNSSGRAGKSVIALGMVPGGGLFVPFRVPDLPWSGLRGLDYSALAKKVISLYLPDMGEEVLGRAVEVYRQGAFAGVNPAPLLRPDGFGILELWHGPTAAFKDMALQVLPHLLRAAMKELEPGAEVLILTATSGDTGKAALEGFKDVPGTRIVVFYPSGGVSAVQERQMTTAGGQNTYVAAVEGNFDRCQSGVKEIFASTALAERLRAEKIFFSSANSINWGRLLPQIVYYYWAYLQAVEQGHVGAGALMNVAVPTGNFGNILAGYYAKRMGLPLGRLICASNKNKVLSDFFETGVYQSRRPFFLTMSPSMDILVSSNFERFLYEMSGRQAQSIRQWYDSLAQTGSFQVDAATLARSRSQIFAGWADEPEVRNQIQRTYREHGYVLDPHTAVAARVYEDYRLKTGDPTFTVILSTASPFKFATSVLNSIEGKEGSGNEWQDLELLQQESGWEIPAGLRGLEARAERKVWHCSPKEMSAVLLKELAL